jgi:late competence protein required for DNA uptake (superfamily II DNA/RNA helicase)
MGEGELESTMLGFSSGEADILVCTTIIESGLDIPRVNTILIEDAHRLASPSCISCGAGWGDRAFRPTPGCFIPVSSPSR